MHLNNITSLNTEEETQTISEESKDKLELYEETQKYSALETIMIIGIVALAVAASFYLYSNNISLIPTEYQLLVYMFAMMIAPSAFFLLLLHFYAVYKAFTLTKKPMILPLDLVYFFYVVIAGGTMFSLYNFYFQYNISIGLFSLGWTTGAILIIVEIPFAFLLARLLMITKISSTFPNLYSTSTKPILWKPRKKQIVVKPTPQIYYVKQHPPQESLKVKPNLALWQDDPSFIKYEHHKKKHQPPKP